MSEETYENVKTIRVTLQCECGGEMKPTGVFLTMYPPLYPHFCEKCGNGENLNTTYPYIDYVTINED